MTTFVSNADYVAYLRRKADFYEQHPALMSPVPSYLIDGTIYFAAKTMAQLDEALAEVDSYRLDDRMMASRHGTGKLWIKANVDGVKVTITAAWTDLFPPPEPTVPDIDADKARLIARLAAE